MHNLACMLNFNNLPLWLKTHLLLFESQDNYSHALPSGVLKAWPPRSLSRVPRRILHVRRVSLNDEANHACVCVDCVRGICGVRACVCDRD